VEACPHSSVVDLGDDLPESLVVTRVTGHEAVDREAKATWTDEALQGFGESRGVAGMR
jgi:hypothetical protein